MHDHKLVSHRDIQNWVSARHGQPAISRECDQFGVPRPRLTLSFPRRQRPTGLPSVDDGVSPVSWTAWLAELDRQGLALAVDEAGPQGFSLVSRKELH
jgi:hypothetical protein